MQSRRRMIQSLSAAVLLPRAIAAHAASARPRLLIGTGTAAPSTSQGIYLADFDPATGSIATPVLVAPLESPTWLALAPHAPRLYAISETRDAKVSGYTLRRGKAHSLTLQLINQQSAEGPGSAHVSLNRDGRSAFVSNYGGGSITSYTIDRKGALSAPVTHIQYTPVDDDPIHSKPHAHQATPSPNGRFLLVNDLGSDRILIYRIDRATAVLTPNTPAFWQARHASGPRHIVFHPNGRWVYNINELDSTIDHLLWDSTAGTLTTAGGPVSTLAADFPKGKAFASELVVSPDGRFLYAGNRRNETIAVLAIAPAGGALTLAQLVEHGGRSARHIALDPSASFLLVALQDSNGIAVLRRDASTGQLSKPLATYPIDSPQCLVFTT